MKKEFLEAIKIIRNFNVWSELAYSQIRTRYARTVLGPLWELIGLVFLLIPLAVLWSKLWERPISDFFVYLFTGYSLFRFISTTIGDASQNFISGYGPLIKNININPLVCTLSLCFRNMIFFGHILIFILFLGFFFELKINYFLLLIFLVCLFFSLLNVSTLIAFLCVRYRDLSNLIGLFMSLLFFFTPIIWDVNQLSAKHKILFIEPNLLYHYIEFFRSSILNGNVNNLSFYVVIIFTFISTLLNLYVLKNFKKVLVTWI
jgi:ABC-type polysaccharide/polyol phosphate export permease